MITIENNVKAFNNSLKTINVAIDNVLVSVPAELIAKQKLLQFDDVEMLPYILSKEGTIMFAGQNLQQRFENGELGDLQKQLDVLKASISTGVCSAIKEKLL